MRQGAMGELDDGDGHARDGWRAAGGGRHPLGSGGGHPGMASVIYFKARDGADLFDTVIQLSNTSTDPVYVHCFYENANSHCTNTGEV